MVFVGLTRDEFNGARGIATDFCDGRYVVQRDGPEGRLVRVKPSNLTKEDGGEEARNRKRRGKGKGKKGRKK